jgi:hypothetical protein
MTGALLSAGDPVEAGILALWYVLYGFCVFIVFEALPHALGVW